MDPIPDSMNLSYPYSHNMSVNPNQDSLKMSVELIEDTHKMSVDLLPTLLQIFLTVFLGWIAGATNIFGTEQSQGISTFVGKFSLPALIFISLATLDFSDINWSFLLAILISKTIIFTIVCIVEFCVQPTGKPRAPKAAIFAIFCTQTNDFGMGLPILHTVFGPDHPFVGLLYLVAPISLLILNPIGFLLIEASRSSDPETNSNSALKRFSLVVRGLVCNPILSMTVLGMVANFIFHRDPPDIMVMFLTALGAAFTSLAPFSLGLSMVGRLNNIRGENVKPILFLNSVKCLVTPILTRGMVGLTSVLLEGKKNPAMSNFGFLYGTFPTALGVDSYASHYNLQSDIVSAAILVGTLVSAPLMYISANILTVIDFDDEDIHATISSLRTFDTNISQFSIVAILYITLLFLLGRKFTACHVMTLTLLLSCLQTSEVALFWTRGIMGDTDLWRYIQAGLYLHGTHSARISTGLLSFVLMLVTNGRMELIKRRWIQVLLVITGPLLVAVFLSIAPLVPYSEHVDSLAYRPFGTAQSFLGVFVNLFCISITVICLWKSKSNIKIDDELNNNSEDTDSSTDLIKTDKSPSPQKFRHSILLILLSCAMFSDLNVCFSQLVYSHIFPGFYKIILQINIFLTNGQGLLFLAVFGIDSHYIIKPLKRILKWIQSRDSTSWFSFKNSSKETEDMKVTVINFKAQITEVKPV